MCGIVGFLSPQTSLDSEHRRTQLNTAAGILSHRGPDAAGVVVWSDHGVGFGHCRLSILDLDERANQPMVSSDGNVLLTYNGEIYNFREIREELLSFGVSWKTTGDTEVILEGYRRWGLEGFLKRCAGMFALGLYDGVQKRIYLVRDRAGKKPLFYSEQNGGIAFSSEIQGLLPLLSHRPGLNARGLHAYLTLKFVPSPLTLFHGIHKVPPGCYLTLSAGQASQTVRYWTPFSANDHASFSHRGEILKTLDRRFSTAVERRMISDVPVCVFLSGGMDSSLVAAKLSRMGHGGMRTYTVGYNDLPAYNEFEYAKDVAERCGADYQEVRLSSASVLDVLQQDRLILDEPISDWVWVPLYFLSERARSDGFKVVLMGEGSDEVFFGYDFMAKGLRDIRRWRKPFWKFLGRMGNGVAGSLYRQSFRGHRRFDLMRRVAKGEPVYLGSSVGFPPSQKGWVTGTRLPHFNGLDEGIRFIGELTEEFHRRAPQPDDDVSLISYVEYYAKMGEVLLQRVDRITMQHSLEARCPFLDHELTEFAFSLPGAAKFHEGRLKALLKDYARDLLPSSVIDRKKMGFSFPFKEWLRGPLGGAVQATFDHGKIFSDGWLNPKFAQRLLSEHRRGWVDHAPRIWTLYSLSRWYDRWIG